MNGVQGVGSSNLLAPTNYCFYYRELATLLTPCFCLATKLGSNFKIAENNAPHAFFGSPFYEPQ